MVFTEFYFKSLRSVWYLCISGVGHIPRCAVLANRQTGTAPAQEVTLSSHGKTAGWPTTGIPGRPTIAQSVKRQSFPGAKKDHGSGKKS